MADFDIERFFRIRSLLKDLLELERAIEKRKERERKLWFRCYKNLLEFFRLLFNKSYRQIRLADSLTANEKCGHDYQI